ncbi:hypothetical protein [uncultured Friedmanniella sp.]|uniref:hypothetical protein n=1 Tax=uncultured Friedmanniella sp. TaxID=335381 RepID=UPI0035CB1B85
MAEAPVPRLVVLLRVAAASALGSLAAVVTIGFVLDQQIRFPWVVNSGAVLVAALCAVAVAMIAADQESTALAAPVRATGGESSDPATGPAPRPQTRPPALPPLSPGPAAPAEAGFTLTGAAAGRSTGGLSWHEAAERGAAGAVSGAASLSAPPPLVAEPDPEADHDQPVPPASEEIRLTTADPERAVRRVVQCPRCGSFGVLAVQVRDGCSFECHDCGHPWHWRPGTPEVGPDRGLECNFQYGRCPPMRL